MGEQSMDLATPLRASTLLPENHVSETQESPYIDPPSIALPPSPLSSQSPELSPVPLLSFLPSPSALSGGQAQTSKESQIERIERELADARQDLVEKEHALFELQTVVANLRSQGIAKGVRGGRVGVADV